MTQQTKEQLDATISKAVQLLAAIDLTQLQKEKTDIEQQTYQPGFWNSPTAQDIMRQIAALKAQIEQIETVEKLKNDVEAYEQLLTEEIAADENSKNSQNLETELHTTLKKLTTAVDELELNQFLSGKYDSYGAIVSIHSGQGGTEAMDWASMLQRMYLRYFERKNWKHLLLEESRGEDAGIKSVEYEVRAPYAFGYLKGERGTHPLVPQKPFHADNLRQTSFALVEVMPPVENDTDIIIKD